MRKFTSLIVLAVYAAYALPGSGGLHAVLGIQHPHCHELHAPAPEMPADSHSCPNGLHAAGDVPAHSHSEPSQPSTPAPTHAADCQACQWFAQGQAIGFNVEIEFSGEPVLESCFVFAATLPADCHSAVWARGPPVA